MKSPIRLFVLVLVSFIPLAVFAQSERQAAVVSPRLCCAQAGPNMADWWTFDEPSGSYGDIAGAVNNVGAVHGPVGRIAGEVGRAAQFNGTIPGCRWPMTTR